MNILENKLNFDGAVNYHYGEFPPKKLDISRLVDPLVKATDAIARYDQMLGGMRNSQILLAPLRRQEAVISSRMEGTISTMDEILRYEADQTGDGSDAPTNTRSEVLETYMYHRALTSAQQFIEEEDAAISEWLIRAMHEKLLAFGRGATLSPGEYKNEQNYVVDKSRRNVLFVPVSVEMLTDGMQNLISFIQNDTSQLLLKTAIAHIEFEALHPFKDGNGRLGRMLITLMLWNQGCISAPHFYVSGYLEERKNEYIDAMKAVSSDGSWTEWCIFFLDALEKQAVRNLAIAESIQHLYEEMKTTFGEILGTRWHINALDFVFSYPYFRNSRFTRESGIPSSTAARFSRLLAENDLLITLEEPSGRRAAMYAFEPLMKLVRV